MQMENTNGFLPEGYEQPKGNSGYMKLQKGENKFRILSKPVIGWEDWKDKKPHRFKMADKPERSFDPTKKIKHFWAFLVWNYLEKEIQILEITQSSIQGAIKNYSVDDDWGSPFDYDIKVTKSGEGMETEYAIAPVPHKPLTEEVKEAFKAKPVNLEALFEGNDPFDAKDVPTPENDLPF